MITAAILCAFIIFLFGGYLDVADDHATALANKILRKKGPNQLGANGLP